MNTSVINKSFLSFQPLPAFFLAEYPARNQETIPSQRCTWELVDEAELADELTHSLTNPVLSTPVPEVDPDDFERIYQWFLS